MRGETLQVLPGGYAVETCPRETHDEYENNVFAQWVNLDTDGAVDLRDYDADKWEHVDVTVRAMESGARVVLGGRLPDDPAGGRTGKPPILVRETDGPGYHPAEVKDHPVLDEKATGGLVTCLHAPARDRAVALSDHGLHHREPDLLALAHYWRMLEACGFQAQTAWGAVCGNDQPDDPLLAWYDLTEPRFHAFSRTHGTVRRSALERYDHEHADEQQELSRPPVRATSGTRWAPPAGRE